MKLSKLGLWPIPTRAYESMLDEMDNFLDGFFEPLGKLYKRSSYPYDIYTKKDENGNEINHTIEIALAGVSKDRISITVKDEMPPCLTVSVSKKGSDDSKQTICKQTSDGQFSLSLTLTKKHDISKVTSSLVDGLLTIVIPFVEKKETEVIEVKIS